MTRLEEIEGRDVIGLDNLFWDDQRWLINRVKRLTKIIKDRCSCYECIDETYAWKCKLCKELEGDE